MSERPPPRTGTGRPVSRPSPAPGPADPSSRTRDLLQAAPKIEVPKGGGALRGIGETFRNNPVTGSSGLEIPLGFPPGRGGLGPSVGLSYDSGAGNGVFGMGMLLSVPSVRRKTDQQLPRYRDSLASDTFVLSSAEDLVPVGETRTVPDGSETWTVLDPPAIARSVPSPSTLRPNESGISERSVRLGGASSTGGSAGSGSGATQARRITGPR